MNINTTAVVFWVFLGGISWLLFGQDTQALVAGVCTGLGVSLMVDLIP